MQRYLIIFVLLLPLVSAAQKNRKKESSEEKVRTTLIQRAEVATTVGDLDSAQALLAKALWMWPDSETNLKQARLFLMRSDTIGYCRQVSMYTQESAEDIAFYQRQCTQRDSIPFALCGLSATEFPGIANVSRTWFKADSTTTYAMFDRSDSLRYRVTISEQDTLYGYVDQMPSFPGGEAELFKFLGKNIRYPTEALEAGGLRHDLPHLHRGARWTREQTGGATRPTSFHGCRKPARDRQHASVGTGTQGRQDCALPLQPAREVHITVVLAMAEAPSSRPCDMG